MKDISHVHEYLANLFQIDSNELFIGNRSKYEMPMRILLLVMNEYYKIDFEEMRYNYAYARKVNLPTFIYDTRLMLSTNNTFRLKYKQIVDFITNE